MCTQTLKHWQFLFLGFKNNQLAFRAEYSPILKMTYIHPMDTEWLAKEVVE